MVEVTTPADKPTSVKTFQNLAKYVDLETTTLPIVIEALRMIPKGTKKYRDLIPGSPKILQKKKERNHIDEYFSHVA